MGATLGWGVAGVLAPVYLVGLAELRPRDWRHLEQLLDELASGRKPEGFVFRHGGRFARLTYPLEKNAHEQENLHREIHDESFNFRTILESMEECVLVVDGHHTLRLVNTSFVALFDLLADPVGQKVLHTLRETAFEEFISTALRTGQAQRGDVERTADKRHFAVHAVPVREFAGSPGVVAIIRDITRLRQLEEVRREFVANVSHELRTPLSIFHGYVENLIDAPDMPRPDQFEIFDILRKHSRRLNALLEDLLTLARLESRQEKMACISMELPALLRSVASDWGQKLAAKKLAIKVEAPDDLPRVAADPQRLEQVLHNLLENAVKFTESGGSIHLRAAASNGAMEVRVEDSGQGIPQPISRTSSSDSIARTKPAPANWAVPALAFRSSNTSSSSTAAPSPPRANMAKAPRSSYACRWTLPQTERRVRPRMSGVREVIFVGAFDLVSLLALHADTVVDHQFRQSGSVNENDLLADFVHKIARALGKIAGGNEDAFVSLCAREGTDEIPDSLHSHGVFPALGLDIDCVEAQSVLIDDAIISIPSDPPDALVTVPASRPGSHP